MTIHEALFSAVRQPMMSVCFLLLMLQMVLLLMAFGDAKQRRNLPGCLMLLALGFTVFYLQMLDICICVNEPETEWSRFAVRTAFVSLPAVVVFVYEGLTILLLIALFRDFFRYRKNHPSFESIKETMDQIPEGIAFARMDGTVVFSNLAMNSFSRALTGKALTDLSALRSAAGLTGQETQVPLPGGTAVWLLKEEASEMDGESYIQLTASDISAQASITRDLEEKNKKLRDIHMRLDIYNRQAERIIIAQELFTARMAVHNELGSILLESRHYLNEPEVIDEEILLQALKNTNTYLLREYEQDDTAGDALTEALETAEAIGVDVEIYGVLPEDEPQRGILAAAVAECATNTVKHADGNHLEVRIGGTESRTVYTFRNNGMPPEKEIRESGGLLSLRRLIEKEEGVMKIESRPQAVLTIELPRARKTDAEDSDVK